MRYRIFAARHAVGLELEKQLRLRLDWLEQVEGDVVALASSYPSGFHIHDHHHIQSQLLHAITGVAMVTTKFGRWMVPPHHALWLPAGIEHAVDMLGEVAMHSIYVRPNAVEGLKSHLHVVGLTPLMDNLIREAVAAPPDAQADPRTALVMGLLLHEIPEPAGAAARSALSGRSAVGGAVPRLPERSLATRQYR